MTLDAAAVLKHFRDLGGEIDAIHSRLTRLEQQARERDAHHEAERQRWHEHLAIWQKNLWAMIQDNRRLRTKLRRLEAVPVITGPDHVIEFNSADLARFHRELPINQSREY